MGTKFKLKHFGIIVLLALLYMPIFGHLGKLPIRIWDESRLAVNAYEMLGNGNYLVTHYENAPDLWNTKPPLMIWCQVLCMKIFGVNELAIRLPSAIAALLTCLVLFSFANKYLKNYWLGFIATMVLITTHGYINIHATRTGDYDALLTLFCLAGGLSFFIYCETKKVKWLYIFFTSFALAVLTKSITGLLFLPAIVIYSLIQKQLFSLLRNKHFYFGLLIFLLPIVGYYLWREALNPGYLQAVWLNELGGRFSATLEGHKADFWYYINNFIRFQLSDWYLLVPCGILVGLFIKNNILNRLTLFVSLMAFTFLLLISSAQTKLEWYDVPMYPFLAILIAIFLTTIFNLLADSQLLITTFKFNILPYIFLFFVLIFPYKTVIHATYKPVEYPWDKEFYNLSYFLQDAVASKKNLNNHVLAYDGYHAHLLFYVYLLNKQGNNIIFKPTEELNDGETVIIAQPTIKEFVESHFNYEMLHNNDLNVLTYKIHDFSLNAN